MTAASNTDKRIAGANKIIVRVSSDTIEKVVMPSGVEFYMDTSWQPYVHATISGTVVALPEDVDSSMAGYENCKSDVIRIGDTVYFNYLVCDKRQRIYFDDDSRDSDGLFYSVNLHSVFCVIRDGALVPYGGWNFIIPLKLKDDVSPKRGLIAAAENYTTGNSRYKGIWMAGTLKGVEKRSIVLFHPIAAFENRIEGMDFYVMQERYIMAVIK